MLLKNLISENTNDRILLVLAHWTFNLVEKLTIG
jgi:hypothetical protein